MTSLVVIIYAATRPQEYYSSQEQVPERELVQDLRLSKGGIEFHMKQKVAVPYESKIKKITGVLKGHPFEADEIVIGEYYIEFKANNSWYYMGEWKGFECWVFSADGYTRDVWKTSDMPSPDKFSYAARRKDDLIDLHFEVEN